MPSISRVFPFGPLLLLAAGAHGLVSCHLPGDCPPAGSVEPEQVLWLSDFESARDLSRWKQRGVSMTLSEQHASHGRGSARVVFGRGRAPGISLGRSPLRDRCDWSGFGSLSFDLHNPHPGQQRLSLRVRDARRNEYREKIHVSAGSTEALSLPLTDLADYLDLRHVTDLTIYRREPESETEFYVDAVRLEPRNERELVLPGETAESGPGGLGPGHPRTGEGRVEVLAVSSARKIFPDAEELDRVALGEARVELARNELESIQVAVRSPDRLRDVRVVVGELRHREHDGIIPAGAVTWSAVQYVRTKRPGYAVSRVGLWPDPLPGQIPFEVEPERWQPVWLTVRAAPSLRPGEYSGTVSILSDGRKVASLPLTVEVWDFELPRTPALKTAFDVYENRIASGYGEFFPDWWRHWEPRREELADLFYRDLVRRRISPVLNLDLDAPGALDRLESLRAEGLSSFAVGRRGGSFGNNWPDDAAALEALGSMYRRYAAKLRERSLLDDHYVYTYDEPPPGLPRVAAVARAIHRADPGLRNLVVLEDSPDVKRIEGWFEDIDIVCLRNVTFEPEQAARLREMGKEVWIYVSGPSPPYPTLVVDYPAISYRILPWMAWKYDVTGFLYWCVNFWTTNPWEDPMNTRWEQNGNGSLYYPGARGPIPSIRLEVTRDGIEDYEYFHILRALVDRSRSSGTEDPEIVKRLESAEDLLEIAPSVVGSMKRYTKDPRLLARYRRAVAKAIEELRRLSG